MSSHQDYLQRLRVAHVLQDPAASLPSVLSARDYAEIKAFVVETAVPTGASSSLLLTPHQQLKIDDPRKYSLRGLPISLVSGCPPAYPMCAGDDLQSRANRTAPRGYPQAPGACVRKPTVEKSGYGFTGVQRCLLPCGGFVFVKKARRPPCFSCA